MLLISEAAYSSARDPVFWYLLGRQYFRYYEWDRAIARLDRAIALNIEKVSPSLWLEIRMVKAQSLFRQRRYDEAHRLFEQIATDPNVRLGLRLQAVDWVRRCRFRKASLTAL